MASTNFLPFDPNKENVMGDTEYNSSQQRLNGVQGGIASSKLHNKSMIQTSLAAAAIAQYMVSAGYDALDTDTVAGFADKLKHAILANQTGLAKATAEMVETGTDDTAYITSYLLKHFYDYWRATREQGALQSDNTHYVTPQVMHANKQWRELERITVSKNWIVPDGIYRIGVFAQGGGASGEGEDIYRNDRIIQVLGGAAGYVCCGVLNVTPGQSIKITIGSGGVFPGRDSGPGGDTEVGSELIAYGGGSPNAPWYKANFRANRGYTCPVITEGKAPFGLYMYLAEENIISFTPNIMGNVFDPSMVIGSAGGSIYHDEDNTARQNTPVKCDLGTGGVSVLNRSGDAYGGTAQGNGCGGGAALSADDRTYKGGSGSSGIVIIYV